MRLFGLEITRGRGLTAPAVSEPEQKSFGQSVLSGMGGWFSVVREAFTGAWQRGEELRVETALSHPTLFRCVSMIASDIAKMSLDLVEESEDGVWIESASPSFSPVLTKPNHYQNRIQFFTQWVLSKFLHGNTYVLKERDNRGVVVALYVLDPTKVRPLVTPDGGVYYQLGRDNLAFVEDQVVVAPASEIIHDRWNTLFHPLVGLSPIYACGLAALEGLEIQRNATRFFRNGSQPGGVLMAPGKINDGDAERLKTYWAEHFTGENVGRIAVLGNGLTYQPMSVSAVDAQLIEQLKWTSETVCSVLGVPAYKVGVGPAPLNNNVEALDQQYYSQCLQIHIESIELCLDEGLALPAKYGVQFHLDDLLRMDTATQITTLKEAVSGALMKPDEARAKLGLGKVKGGDAVYSQQQNYSLEALAKRDAKADPFGAAKPANPAASPPAPAVANDLEPDAVTEAFGIALGREITETLSARAA